VRVAKRWRAVVQLVEHRSPKPGVGGSNPFCPARWQEKKFGSKKI
jgi:hypothetical protein